MSPYPAWLTSFVSFVEQRGLQNRCVPQTTTARRCDFQQQAQRSSIVLLPGARFGDI
jgi:hypothetical protein